MRINKICTFFVQKLCSKLSKKCRVYCPKIGVERKEMNMYANQMQPQYGNGNNYYYNVNGFEGAKNFQIAPNQSVLLIDTLQPYLYFKSSNQIGQITIKTYKLEELPDNPETMAQNKMFQAFDERLKQIEERLNQNVSKSVANGYAKQ